MLAKVVASLWPDVYSNAVDLEWDPTKMGRRGAPNNLQKGCETQAWLAVANDNKAMVAGNIFTNGLSNHSTLVLTILSFRRSSFCICEELSGASFSVK